MGDYFDTKGDGTHSWDTGDETPTIREACRRRMPLGGVDAEALEHGLTQLEEENQKLRAALQQAEESDAESLRLYRSARLRADNAGRLVEHYRDALAHITELRHECIVNAIDIAKKALTEKPSTDLG